LHFTYIEQINDWKLRYDNFFILLVYSKHLIYLAALNDALKQELERLKHATGEMTNSSETYNMRFQHVPYNSSFFPLSQQNASPHLGSTQLPPPFHPPHPNVPNHQMISHPNTLPEIMQQESLGRLQGLDIGKGPLVVKSESSSISASESSSTF